MIEEYQVLSRYQILCVLERGLKLLVSRFNNLYVYDIASESYNPIVSLPFSSGLKILSYSKILQRLLRSFVRYAIPIDDDTVLVVLNKQFYEVDLNQKTWTVVHRLKRGSRPLSISNIKDIDGFVNGIYFGEYFSNKNKNEVHIYKKMKSDIWEPVYSFPKKSIKHIHALIPDNRLNCVWILTGDLDNECAIWMAKDNFKDVKSIVMGNQDFRSCVAFPVKEGLLYATDSELNNNSIRLLSNQSGIWHSKKICDVNGSVIYGCKIDNQFVFSTSVEGNTHGKNFVQKYLDTKIAPGIKSPFVNILMGNLTQGFSVVSSFKKDKLPFLLFQFGAITFPVGINNSSYIFMNYFALKRNDMNSTINKIK